MQIRSRQCPIFQYPAAIVADGAASGKQGKALLTATHAETWRAMQKHGASC
jgi:hypothetical protein